MAYGDFVVMRDLNFTVRRGDIFIIMGGSGCGKSTLLRHLIGLNEPAQGEVCYGDVELHAAAPDERERDAAPLRRALPERRAVELDDAGRERRPAARASTPISRRPRSARSRRSSSRWSGCRASRTTIPSEISGGMQKRAGLARAMALDPDILFFDEPSAGLDPISSRLLDDLILELRDSLGATIVIVTHELASIFAIGDNCVFLDAETRTMIARGNPRELLEHSDRTRTCAASSPAARRGRRTPGEP